MFALQLTEKNYQSVMPHMHSRKSKFWSQFLAEMSARVWLAEEIQLKKTKNIFFVLALSTAFDFH